MKIGLLNLEPKYKNLAIEKLRLYHTQKGDEVEDYFALNHYDKVYCSSIFTFTPKYKVPQGAICGGSGFDLTTTLPQEIEEIEPHLNFGFTTRGCIRRCPFCIVHIKEPILKIVIRFLRQLWDGKGKTITLYDNNILAFPEHFESICQQSLDLKISLDFNQGLDHRLLTPEIANLLKSISHDEYRFAFDSPTYYNSVDRAINLLRDAGINRSLWYVLVGFNTTFREDLNRLNFLRDRGQTAYVQTYNRNRSTLYSALSRWVNQHHLFKAMSWEQFLEHPDSHRRHLLKVYKQEAL